MTLVQKTQWTNTSRWHCIPNYHRLWKLNTGLQATWTMSFSTLPPDSRTLVSKWNTKLDLIWKEDFVPLVNSPVVLLLSPGKTPLTTTVDKLELGGMTKNVYHGIFLNYTGFTVYDGIYFFMHDRVLTTFSTDWGKTAVDWLRMPYFSVMMSEYCRKSAH